MMLVMRLISTGIGFLLAGLWTCSPAGLPAFEAIPVSEFHPAEPGYRYEFPRDHGSHDDFRTEWWYYTGRLATEHGRQFGYQLTFFRRALAPRKIETLPSRWTIDQIYFAHFALSDLGNKTFRYAEKVSRSGIGKAGSDTGRLHVWIDQWAAEAPGSPIERQRLQASSDSFSVDLTATPAKPLVIHGQSGISRKGREAGQASHYYSFTRLETSGTLTIDGGRIPVRGMSWMDHEFGSGDLGADQIGWDWFSIQLNNGMDLMLYRLRRTDGTSDPLSSGTLILPDGRSSNLPAHAVRIDVLDYWSSPASGGRYPCNWLLSIPEQDLKLHVVPVIANQELMTRRSTQVTYWEGAVDVSGTLHGQSVTGQGYVELTGYAHRFTP